MAKTKVQDQETPYETKYEKSRLIGARALQIAQGAPILVKLSTEDLAKINYNPVEIAKLEYEAGLIPMTIIKPMPREHHKKGEE